jgi:hypothetical protein
MAEGLSLQANAQYILRGLAQLASSGGASDAVNRS